MTSGSSPRRWDSRAGRSRPSGAIWLGRSATTSSRFRSALGFLNPLIAGAAMVLSSGFVVWNSSRLGKVRSDQPAARASWGTNSAALIVPTPEARS